MRMYDAIKLKNGITLVNVVDKNTSISVVSFWFHAGSNDDPIGKEGLAHLTEHLTMRRTKKHKTELARLKRLEKDGIFFNAYVDRDTTCYYQTQLTEDTLLSLKKMLNDFNTMTFCQKDLEQEKKNALNELMEEELTRNAIYFLSEENLLKKKPQAKHICGSKKSLSNVSLKDIRDFMKNHYSKKQLTVVVLGNEKTAVLKEILQKEKNDLLQNAKKSVQKIEKPRKLVIYNNGNENSCDVAISFRGYSFEESLTKIVSLDLWRDILANSWNARLMRTLRFDHNLAYWVEGNSKNSDSTGLIRFIFSVQTKQVHKSIALSLDVFEKIQQRKLHEKDLEGYKKFFLGNVLSENIDPYNKMFWYGKQATLSQKEKLFTIDEYKEAIKKITVSRMQSTAREVFLPEKRSIIILGDLRGVDLKCLERSI